MAGRLNRIASRSAPDQEAALAEPWPGARTQPATDPVAWLDPREPGRPKDECGVFGIWGHPGAARVTMYALFALQHRGQESAGIAATDGEHIRVHRGMGLVSEAIIPDELEKLVGRAAIGHVRYSTTGSSELTNAQPLLVRHAGGELALGHNGNLTNARALRAELEDAGSIFQTSIDTEVVAHLIARRQKDGLEPAIEGALSEVEGGFAFVFLTPTMLIGARDPNGIRPLSLGRLGDAWCLASESCAFDTVGAEYVRDVEPGEIVLIDRHGLRSRRFAPRRPERLCVFEYVYFARPDSDLDGANVHAVRRELGRRLAIEHPAEADLVIGVPDSSISAAMGYAEQAGLPYETGLIKNRYIGRTFIQPSPEARQRGVKLKLNALRQVVAGKRVVLVDDSIVRGTTSRQIVQLLRDAGASEVHLRISSPPYRFACHYGIDTSATDELVAYRHSVETIRQLVGADSLGFLGLEGMLGAVGARREAMGQPARGGYCTACFTGEYPVPVDADLDKYAFEAHREGMRR